MNDPFELFGLDPESATLREARTRYYELAKMTHPDRGGSAEEMSAVTAAYEFIVSKLASVRVAPRTPEEHAALRREFEQFYADVRADLGRKRAAGLAEIRAQARLEDDGGDGAREAPDPSIDREAFNAAFSRLGDDQVCGSFYQAGHGAAGEGAVQAWSSDMMAGGLEATDHAPVSETLVAWAGLNNYTFGTAAGSTGLAGYDYREAVAQQESLYEPEPEEYAPLASEEELEARRASEVNNPGYKFDVYFNCMAEDCTFLTPPGLLTAPAASPVPPAEE